MNDSYKVVQRVTVMDNPNSLFRYFGWPSICRLSDGRLAAAASGFRRGHVCPWGKAVLSFSSDEGRTWTCPMPVIDTVLDDRDSGIVPLGGSRVMVTSFNNTVHFQRWYNDIARKDPATPAGYCETVDAYLSEAEASGLEQEQLGSTYRISDDNCVTFGPLFRSPVTAPHGPCVTEDGRILYIGHPFDDMTHPAEDPTLQCWELDGKGGATYLSSIPAPTDEFGGMNDVCEPHTLCLPEGKLIVHIRVQRGGEHPVYSTWQSVSEDGGKTFCVPYPVTGVLGGAPAHLLMLSCGDLISVIGDRQPPYGIRVLRSTDCGKSWSERMLVTGLLTGDIGYPASVELKNGNVFTLWYGHPTLGEPAVILGAEWDPRS